MGSAGFYLIRPVVDDHGQCWVKSLYREEGQTHVRLREALTLLAGVVDHPVIVDYSSFWAWWQINGSSDNFAWVEIPHPRSMHSGSTLCSNCDDLPELDDLPAEAEEIARERVTIIDDDPFAQERSEDLQETIPARTLIDRFAVCCSCGEEFILPEDEHCDGEPRPCPVCLEQLT